MRHTAHTMWGLTNRPNPVILCMFGRLISSHVETDLFLCYTLHQTCRGSGDPRTSTDHCPVIPSLLFFWSCCLQIKDQRHTARIKMHLPWNKWGRCWRSEQPDSELLWNMMIWNTAPTSDNNEDKVDTGFCCFWTFFLVSLSSYFP